MDFNLKILNNEIYLELIESTTFEYQSLVKYFTRKVHNWQFKKKKDSKWDGFIKFIVANKYLPIGLWGELKNFSEELKINVKIKNSHLMLDSSIKRKDFIKFVDYLFENYEIYPRDYQIETAYRILRWKRSCAELATSAGKSLIMFLVAAYIKKFKNPSSKILIIVPNVNLVEQLMEDFIEYDKDNKLDLNFSVIFSGSKKVSESAFIHITTYQSAIKKPKEYFQQFQNVFIDEAHRITSLSIRKIISKCINKELICGLSGTLPLKNTADYFTIQSNTGPLVNNITAKDLTEAGYLTPCKIKILNLDWLEEDKKESLFELYSNQEYDGAYIYSLEGKIISESEKRLNKVASIVNSLKGNRLVLFKSVKNNYGKRLVEKLKKLGNEKVHYIDGSVPKNKRDIIIKKMREGGDDITVATYKTMGEGLSIKPIEFIFFTESYKSESIIRQSIGRGLRKYKNKKTVTIIDFVDNFIPNNLKNSNWKNYQILHSDKRISIYEEQQFNYESIDLRF